MAQRLLIAIALVSWMLACNGPTDSPGSAPLTPAAPSGIGTTAANGAANIGAPATSGRQDVVVNMQDACDPDTFNAAFGPRTCLRSGGVKFDQFIAELRRLGFVGPWHFAPSTANVRVGQTFVAMNRGGETHTFTEVAAFGGGIVPLLNQLAHVPTEAPECAALESDDFVAPGGMYREKVDRTGALKFQCCIHPWMRLEASSR
jgi:plastocyanin